MATIGPLLATARLPFLALTPASMVLGLATAIASGHDVPIADVVIALLGGLAAHAAVNAFNEYFDFRSGLDLRTERTPFSGGSGALPANPALAQATLAFASLCLVFACGVGLHFLRLRGLALLPIGLAGVAVVLAYTPWVTRQPAASLVAPGLGVGPLMVIGTHVALTGTHAPAAWAASLVPFFLANGLLLLNQFPDVEADRSVGRRHLPMLLGRPRAARLHAALLVLAYLSLLGSIAIGALPAWSALGLLTAPLAVAVAIGARRHADDIPGLQPTMGRNVVVVLLTPVLTAVGILLA